MVKITALYWRGVRVTLKYEASENNRQPVGVGPKSTRDIHMTSFQPPAQHWDFKVRFTSLSDHTFLLATSSVQRDGYESNDFMHFLQMASHPLFRQRDIRELVGEIAGSIGPG